jgi:transketolase
MTSIDPTRTDADHEAERDAALDAAAIVQARLLALDAVERADSGHPGTAIALAPVAHLLFQRFIRHDPSDPSWAGRDRFVLSCGHASILLYSQLFLTGYDVSLDDLRGFRALGSRTPGHPEFGHTAGVETTTGPLGQGLATAVGMAMAFARDRGRFAPLAQATDATPFDNRVWVIASDGDLQEGISAEAGALAGRHRLDNLTVIYDDNDIQIEGDTALTSSEDVAARFSAQGWQVDHVPLAPSGDVDLTRLEAVLASPGEPGRPRLVVLKSQIAWPAPNARNTAAAHGAPLGGTEAALVRDALGVRSQPFELDQAAVAHARRALERGHLLHERWDALRAEWERANPAEAQQLEAESRPLSPQDFEELAATLPRYEAGQSVSTRDASGASIQALAAALPALWGGSADLAEPNRTAIAGGGSFLPENRAGRNVHWGVREHAMAAALNGITLVGGGRGRAFAGTFLVFSDYQKPALRLAALMQLPVVHLWSHDSVALGSDGPTHQPIEHLAALRALPGFSVVRPADGAETAAAWLATLQHGGPTGIVLARQAVEVTTASGPAVTEGVRRGGYVVDDEEGFEVIVIATGSEVALARAATAEARAQGLRVRVVSLPSREWFAEQSPGYREQVLPTGCTARVVVEAATSFGWHDIAGSAGAVVGIDGFGLSAPAEEALAARGMTVERVLGAIRSVAGH